MMTNNSTEKKITISNYDKLSNDNQYLKENSLTSQLRKFKSQDTYINLFNKLSTAGYKKDNENLYNSNKLNENVGINSNTSGKIIQNTQINYQINQLKLSVSTDKIIKGLDSSNKGIMNNRTKIENVPPILNKIMSDESIHELETEENESIDEEDSKQLDEMKSSELITDFYTNSISEANSICKKQNKLINALPQPFVKQIKNKFSSKREESFSKESKKISKEFIIHSGHNVPEKAENKDIKQIINKVISNNIMDIDKSQLSKISVPVPTLSNNINLINNNSGVTAYPKIKTEEEKLKTDLEAAYRKFMISAKKGDREKFLENLEILNQLNGDINYKDESGWTGLHYASDEGNFKIVDILINSLADVNSKTNNKKTPLHLATSHGYFDISKLLVENGCVINSLDDEKNTPIHICASIGHLELLKFLLDKFPQADTKNIYGKSPMDLAKKDEIKLLIQEYLKKNQSIYHRVPILNTNKKAVKILFKNMKTNPNFTRQMENYNTLNEKQNHQIDSYSNEKNFPQFNPIENNNLKSNNSNNIKPHHNKFQSIDFDKNGNQLKAINQLGNAFPNNNINININTNINNPKGPVNVVNIQTPLKDTNSKKVNINEKVKGNIETKMKNEKSTNKNNACTKETLTSSKFQTNKNTQNINPKQKRNNSKLPNKKHSEIPSIKTLINKNNNTDHTEQANKTANYISNNEMSYSTNNQTNENLHKTTTPMINKRNSSNTTKTDMGSKRIIANTTRNIISLSNKAEINLAANNTPDKKFSKISKQNVNNTTLPKKVFNTSNNDNNKSDNELSAKKDSNRTYDVNHTCNLLNITNLSNTKPNKQRHFEEESTMNKIEENMLNEENSLSNNNSQQHIDNDCLEIHSSSMMSMDDGINNLNNINSCSVEEEKTGASEFICHALLGKGSFGEVYLVEKKNTNMIYAMKVLSKDKIMGQNLVKYAMTERNVLSVTNHPFIVKLNYSFQTSNKLFLILDYCPGGDLSLHLERENRFSEQRAKIYICEIILALEDLHKRDIIFRDLKPDNVVLDKEGHALLTDFGLSKEGVFDNKGAKSFCGSIAYLAPEMLKRTGHGKSVDWYLLGVLFYEMLVGIPPYFTNNKDQLFKNIERADLQIPKYVSEKAADLLRALLQRNPLLRLGAGITDAEEIKSHDYFNDVNWEDVYNRKLNPPIPLVYNRILQKFSEPRVFNDASKYCGLFSKYDMISHFNGWSFVNNNASNQQKIKTTTQFN